MQRSTGYIKTKGQVSGLISGVRPVHDISSDMGPKFGQALQFMHAFSGCDFTSALRGIGKKTAWNVWTEVPEITDTFIKLTEEPDSFSIESEEMSKIEQYTVKLYSKSCSASSVNEARKVLFTQSLWPLEKIPPTKKCALPAHQEILVAAFMWRLSLLKQQNTPSPELWGWEWQPRLENWIPYWTDLPDASHGCTILVNCALS